jgi:tetratricopeptide (TPR) repeat protein
MKHSPTALFTTLRLLALMVACASTTVHADEYSDVSQLLRAGKFTEAITKADSYLVAKPRDPQMRFLKGVVQRNAGKTAEAITTFTQLTEDYPELPEPYNNLAVIYAGQNEYGKSRAALEMAIRSNPSYATAHENLGDVYARLASEAYNKALQLDGSNPAVAPKLGIISELFKPNIKSPAIAVTASNTPTKTATAVPLVAVPAPAVVTPVRTPTPVVVATATPKLPVAAPVIAPVKPMASDNAAQAIEAAVHGWAKAWASQEMAVYLNAYGKAFNPPGQQSRSAWERERRQRIVGKSSISVNIDDLKVTVNGNKAMAKFQQSYRSGTLSLSSNKTLEMVRSNDQWLIVKEYTGN